ncbi:RNA polymerase-binding protein DksA [Robiginitomaculum antarcticum]|uniref:RNA polymerase-binding protein DksA n=1 Tax=Robiginitomaculum antarcticum TaxID=437507 RepID=UPI00037B4D12|nr:RNA polymerase-binding protein DksA [Robiginitomaculum antarcticum]
MTAANTNSVTVPEGYAPTADEAFMNPVQREYFRQKLLEWKADILTQTQDTMSSLKEDSMSHPDSLDRASATADRHLELRSRDRQRKLINKIDKALRKIEHGTYGLCEETGDEIDVKRLDARPIATLSIEAQETHERGERTRAG